MTNVFIHNQPLAEKGPPFAGGALVLAVIPDQQIGRQETQASWISFGSLCWRHRRNILRASKLAL